MQIKQYYSELTEIIRTYIDGRFDVNAMEMPSAEILEELSVKELPETAYQELQEMFAIADLVKFAKGEPLAEYHDRCFKSAYEFVQQTKELIAADPKNDDIKKD